MAYQIYFMGNEPEDFPNGAPVNTAGGQDNAFASCTVYTENGFPYIRSKAFEDKNGNLVLLTDFWARFQLYWAGSADSPYAGLGKLGSDNGLAIGMHSANTKPALFKRNGASWVCIAESVQDFALDSRRTPIDFHITGYGTAGCNVKVYCENALCIDYTGDITMSGIAGFDSFIGITSRGRFSEAIAADVPTLGMRLKGLKPTSAGTKSEQDSGTWADVDENFLDTVDFIASNQVNKEIQFNTNDAPAGSYSCLALQIDMVAIKSFDSLVGKLQMGFLSGGVTEYSPQYTLDIATQSFVWKTQTFNGSMFPMSAFNALQLTIKTGN